HRRPELLTGSPAERDVRGSPVADSYSYGSGPELQQLDLRRFRPHSISCYDEMLTAREHFSIAFPLEIQIESGTRRDSDCDLRVDADIGQRPSVRFEDQRQVERVGF